MSRHIDGLLLPNKGELEMSVRVVEESLRLFGVDATLYQKETMSMYADDVNVGGGINLKVMFENNPKKRLLDDLGWFQEYKESESSILFLPYSVNGTQIVPRDYDVLVFKDRVALQITEVAQNYLVGVWYVVKCVPYMKDNKNIGKHTVPQGLQSKYLSTEIEEMA